VKCCGLNSPGRNRKPLEKGCCLPRNPIQFKGCIDQNKRGGQGKCTLESREREEKNKNERRQSELNNKKGGGKKLPRNCAIKGLCFPPKRGRRKTLKNTGGGWRKKSKTYKERGQRLTGFEGETEIGQYSHEIEADKRGQKCESKREAARHSLWDENKGTYGMGKKEASGRRRT